MFNWNETELRYEINIMNNEHYTCLSYVGDGVMYDFKLIKKGMTVQELIDELNQVKDKSIDIDLYDCNSGERYKLLSVDLIMDGKPPHERNIDLNFDSK